MRSILLIIALFLSLPTLAYAQDDRPAAPNFEVDDLDGETVSLSDFDGNVIVVSFWATWCQPCLRELPHMNEYYEEYGDQGLTVLAVSTDGPESLSQVRNIVRRNRWSMPILLDQEGAVTQLLNPRGTNPFTVVIDRDGNIAMSHEGYSAGDEEEYLELILELLEETPSAE